MLPGVVQLGKGVKKVTCLIKLWIQDTPIKLNFLKAIQVKSTLLLQNPAYP